MEDSQNNSEETAIEHNEMKKRRAVAAPEEGSTSDLERKRAISRKSSQRNRQKQRSVLETMQIQQNTLNEKNHALKKDNDQLRERIAMIRRFGVHGLDPAQLDEVRRQAFTDKASVINSGAASSLPRVAAAASCTTTAAVPTRPAPAMNAAAATAAVASTNNNMRRLDLEALKALIQPQPNLTLPHQNPGTGALQQLALLQQFTQRQQPSPFQLLQQQVQNQFLPSYPQAPVSSGSFASNLLQQLAAQSSPASVLSSAITSEGDATTLLLMQSILGAHASASFAPGPAGGLLSFNRSRSADPPGNRSFNQHTHPS
jgi:hypothetical protein